MNNLLSPRAPRPDLERVVTWLSLVLVTLSYLSGISHAQTAVVLAPVPQLQFFDQTGTPLAFGCVFTYAVNSVTPLATYTDYTGVTLNANPVILTAGGSANVWLAAGQAYTFRVASAGGSNCASGSTLYTVNGIGGGSTTLTTVVPYSPTPAFQVAAQNQLFQITLTGNASAQPLTFVGITPPSYVIFEITEDSSGGHSWAWPANSVGGAPINIGANQVTVQTFLYDGVHATATGPGMIGAGPSVSVGNLTASTKIIDGGLTASLPICTDAFDALSSTCTGLITNADLANSSVTYNGQAVALGASGNVNAGDTAHSIALNEGDGNQIGALALAADNVPVGVTSADPAAKALCTGSLKYSTSAHLFSCQPANANGATLLIQSTRLTGSATTFTYPTAYSGTPTCVCSGEGGSCNIASVSNSACTLNITTATNDVIVVGAP